MTREEKHKNNPGGLERHRQKDREYHRKKRAKLKGFKAKEFAQYRKANPEKARAHKAVYRAILAGVIKRLPCAVCGTTKRVHGHHPDYANPLNVIWLCPPHHKKAHQEETFVSSTTANGKALKK